MPAESDWFKLAEEIDTRLDDLGCDRDVAKRLRSAVWTLGRQRDEAREDYQGARADQKHAEEELSTLRELLGLVLRQATMPDALRSRIVACVAGAPEVVALDAERD